MPQDLEIQKIAIDLIKPSPDNEYIHSNSQIEGLARVIEKHGFDVPIVCDENMVILKGHARLEALKKLGRVNADCIIRKGLTEQQKIALRISDNKIPSYSKWNEQALAESFKKLDEELRKDLMFSEQEVKKILDEFDDKKNNVEDLLPEEKKDVFPSLELVFADEEEKREFINITDDIREERDILERGSAALVGLKEKGEAE